MSRREPKKTAPPLKTPEIEQRLAARYRKGDAYAFMFQVSNGTGANASRTADALAVSCWPSRGLYFIGFEIKASRTDWLRELEQAKKAEAVGQFCAKWYVVVGSEDIVRDGELPPTWGLLVPRGDGLFEKVAAPMRPAAPPTMAFLASVMRSAQQLCPDVKMIAEAKRQARAEAAQEYEARSEEREGELKNLRRVIREFEDASGLTLTGGWYQRGDVEQVKKVGALVRMIRDDNWGIRGNLQLLEKVQNLVESFKQSIDVQIGLIRGELQGFVDGEGNAYGGAVGGTDGGGAGGLGGAPDGRAGGG